MKHYMMAIYQTEGANEPPAEDGVDAFNEKLIAAGQWVYGDGLDPLSTTKVIRAKGSEVVTTDGPFAESKEVLGGYWMIEVASREEAIAPASCSVMPANLRRKTVSQIKAIAQKACRT